MPTTINDLPPECLRYVFLPLEDDAWSLAQVLQVNRQFLQLAAPILYADPFSRCLVRSRHKLLKVLLQSMDGFSVSTFSDLMDNICASPSCENLSCATSDHLTAAIAIQATKERVLTMAPYIDFMTVFNCGIWMVSVFECQEEHQFGSYHSGIHNAVLQRRAPKIKSMTLVPLTLTNDLLPLASQMTSLRRLHWAFAFDVSHMDILSRFMTELSQLKGRPGLEEFVLPRMSNLYQMDWTQEQERLILALGDVVSLDARPWPDFVKICHGIPSQAFSRLTQLQLGTIFYQGHDSRFLQQCRALQKLSLPISDGNAFAWAEEEKKKHMATSNLVQLKTLEIRAAPFMVGALLKSIFHGFNHSLENLDYACDNVTYSTDIFNSDEPSIDITTIPDESFIIDSTVRMPRLKKLHINHASSAVEIGQGDFQGCPVLESLSLDGDIICSNGMQGFDVFRIPSLRCLSLSKGAAKYFKLESIRHSPLLVNLTLRDDRSLHTHPSEVHLLKLNTAAWTWTMPHLNAITLSGRSALAFKLEWIRRCPSLETLVLDVVTPATLRPNMTDIAKGPCGERLRTCQLIFFKQEVNKEWFPKVLETYCGHVVELTVRTHDLYLYSWDGVDLGLLLTATEALSSLSTLTVHLGEEWKRVRLVKWYDMVKGKFCYRTSKVIWPPYVKLKKLTIIDNDDSHGRGWYRQRAEESTDSIVVEA